MYALDMGLRFCELVWVAVCVFCLCVAIMRL